MKQFLKFMFASMFGVFLSVLLVSLIFAGIIGSMISASQESSEPFIADKSILHIKLETPIQDRPSNNPFDNFDFSSFEDRKPLGLKNIIDNIEKAASDKKIKGIFLDIGWLQANMATTEELRKALLEFKSSGKFIISYSENYGQNEYYLCSVADEVYLNPAGEMTFKGLAANLMFFKDALDRLDIEMQVIRHGKFKSAIEPFIRNDMSPENEKQYKELIQGIWDNQVKMISESRGIDAEKLNKVADSLALRTAKDAKDYGFVDELFYEDEVHKRLKELIEIAEDDDLEFVELKKFNKTKLPLEIAKSGREKWNSKNKVAIVFAEGDIVSGESKENLMGSTTIAEAIKKARKDEDVKAIVLRVNSPGGSALASDVMWREVVLAKESKPVIVSMGDVAASGGYYISCAADQIFAESSTITGSIGVFGLIPNMKGFLENKIGVHTDHVNTNAYSDGLNALRPMSQVEREAIQEMIEDIYDDFTSKVAKGRDMTQAEVDSIGQGRVWNGVSAKRIGLIDEIGGLKNAIAAAADLAELEDYKIQELPERKDPFQKILSEFAAEAKLSILGKEIGQAEKYYSNIKSVLKRKGIYTRMPVDIIIE
ncbi:MAG: signal peptide peptidase SppA [Vicingaceae bacterium]